MKESIETGIRLKAILIYIVVAVVCFAMIIYVYNLRQEIDSQRQHTVQYQHTLTLTNKFVIAVNQAQAEANLFAGSKEPIHWALFKNRTAEVEQLVDSLQMVAGNDSILNEIGLLLRKKGYIVAELNEQLTGHNPIDTISKQLQHLNKEDSLLVTTTVKDTVVKASPKRGFWRRVADVFSPGSKADSIVKVTTRKTDTVKVPPEKRQEIVSGVDVLAAAASKSYSSRIAAIEHQVNRLILTDQEISLQITGLLHQFSSRTINSTLAEIQKSAQLIRQNYTFSIIGGGVSLALILMFVLLIINDVNKGKAARKALEEANARTRQIMESRHQLLLSVSHDIKTPLNSILGYLELGQTGADISQKQMQSMQNSGKHILALLDNLLEFSSLERGTLTTTYCDFNLWKLCAETVEMFEPLALQKNISFKTNFGFGKNTGVYSDVLKIKQVIINILSNSVKYTSIGEISFEVSYADGKICFCFADTGAGIPADQIGALFKPFARVDANKALAPGSGLGMFVVKGLVELLHGTITVTSAVGKGTRIEVTIPAEPVDEKQMGAVASKNILLIDDDPALLAMLGDMMARLGHTTSQCNPVDFDPHAGCYDMVITDMEMGNVTGTGILDRIRRAGMEATVVVMTGRGDYNEAKAVEAGFDGYLHKPVTLNALEKLTGIVATGCSQETSAETSHPDAGGFALLEEMFDGDRQAIAEVLEVFVSTTVDNISTLRQAIADNHFGQVQAICHKMLPMFLQVDAPDNCTEFLKQMDAARNDSPDKHPHWQENTDDFTISAGKLMERIRRKYLDK